MSLSMSFSAPRRRSSSGGPEPNKGEGADIGRYAGAFGGAFLKSFAVSVVIGAALGVALARFRPLLPSLPPL